MAGDNAAPDGASASRGRDYEILLRWASELGAGSWAEFRDAHDWKFNAGQRDGAQVSATNTIHTFSMLGHLEIDWETGRWAAAPPALTILPNAGAHAVLVGCRNRHLLRAFEAATLADDYFADPHGQDRAPDALFVAATDETAIEALAARLGVAYEICVSERLASLLPSIESYLERCQSTPAARGYGVERFDPHSLRFFREESDAGPGLYRYDVWGRPDFRFVPDGGGYFRVDRALGIHAEIARTHGRFVKFSEDVVNGTLFVPFAAQLPSLHARTAVLCSGLMPRLREGYWRYPNVPSETAGKIARALGQKLVIEGSGRRG